MNGSAQGTAILDLLEGVSFDTIVVPGYGPVLPGRTPGSGSLTIYGRINSLAAAMICRSYSPHNVIVSGARTGGNDKPSEAQLMAQCIQRYAELMDSAFTVEEQATNTILNFIYTANIIDESRRGYGALLVVAMGFHLTRIREICSLVKITAHFVAAEEIVSLRSLRHRQLLRELLDPTRVDYAKTLRDQESFLRALREIPEYWLPQVAELRNPDRLRAVLTTTRIQPFLREQNIEADSMPIDVLKERLRAIPRKLPVL